MVALGLETAEVVGDVSEGDDGTVGSWVGVRTLRYHNLSVFGVLSRLEGARLLGLDSVFCLVTEIYYNMYYMFKK